MSDTKSVPLSATMNEALGTWYINSNGFPIELVLAQQAGMGIRGHVVDENGKVETVDNIEWNAETKRLSFRRPGAGFWQWYDLRLNLGILIGRFSHETGSANRPATNAFRYHATGWNSETIDAAEIVPRVWDIVANKVYFCTLRIDRSQDGRSFIGRWKCYARKDNPAPGSEPSSSGEELEYDLQDVEWDGHLLRFTRADPAWTQVYTGTVSGRQISGSFTQSSVSGTLPWSGTRSNILTYGLRVRTEDGRKGWQAATRGRLMQLVIAGNPAPHSIAVNKGAGPQAPRHDGPMDTPGTDRDDNPAAHPQSYTEREFTFDFALTDPWGEPQMQRRVHSWLAVPNGPAPREGFPAVLAVNGHPGPRGSGAYRMLDPTDHYYWYGDAWARRGYVVMAVDISHRPPPDSQPLYSDFPDGNCAAEGNGPHPAICSSLFPHDSDWEEDGERAWDVLRALDLLLKGDLGVHINPARLAVTGLSLGGEMTTWIGALDPRLSVVIPAGFSPDLNVMRYNGNHPCWRWQHGEIRDYIDTSDLHALIAPRGLLVQTGIKDDTFSAHQPPFAADKQVARRARLAWVDQPTRYVHYLQPWNAGEGVHQYRIGDVLSNKASTPRRGVQVPARIAPEANKPSDSGWQNDGQTVALSLPGISNPTVFDVAAHFWAG